MNLRPQSEPQPARQRTPEAVEGGGGGPMATCTGRVPIPFPVPPGVPPGDAKFDTLYCLRTGTAYAAIGLTRTKVDT